MVSKKPKDFSYLDELVRTYIRNSIDIKYGMGEIGRLAIFWFFLIICLLLSALLSSLVINVICAIPLLVMAISAPILYLVTAGQYLFNLYIIVNKYKQDFNLQVTEGKLIVKYHFHVNSMVSDIVYNEININRIRDVTRISKRQIVSENPILLLYPFTNKKGVLTHFTVDPKHLYRIRFFKNVSINEHVYKGFYVSQSSVSKYRNGIIETPTKMDSIIIDIPDIEKFLKLVNQERKSLNSEPKKKSSNSYDL